MHAGGRRDVLQSTCQCQATPAHSISPTLHVDIVPVELSHALFLMCLELTRWRQDKHMLALSLSCVIKTLTRYEHGS